MMTTSDSTVFVIDDDDLVRTAIRGLLRSAGLRVETFGTTQQFLSSMRPDGPSCLVLDVRLPGVNGLDFQRQWLIPASAFPSSSSLVMAIFRCR